jgi:hypothetical protein
VRHAAGIGVFRNINIIWQEILKGGHLFGNPCVDGRIILKWIVKE